MSKRITIISILVLLTVTFGVLYTLNKKEVKIFTSQETTGVKQAEKSELKQDNPVEQVNTEPEKVTTQKPSTPVKTSNRCIITVNDKKYDVTEFRNKHEGGDIFDCGQDNTEKFYSEHSDGKLKEMEKYLIG